jgi:NTE family protein
MQQRANLPDPSRSLEKRLIAIALQGGGSHGAFTWGVLDRLSGGVNAGVLADGLRRGGASQAQLALSILERSRPPAGIRDPVATVTDVKGERGCLSNRVCGS